VAVKAMNKTTGFNWHVNINEELRHATTVRCAEKGIELRQFVSDAVKEKLQREKEGEKY